MKKKEQRSSERKGTNFDKLKFSNKSFSARQMMNHFILSLVNADLNLVFSNFNFEKLRSLLATVIGKVRRNR